MVRHRLALVAVLLCLAFGATTVQAYAQDKGHTEPPHHSGDYCQDHPSLCTSLPEAPMSMGLPIAGLVVMGGYVLLVRRRHNQPEAPLA